MTPRSRLFACSTLAVAFGFVVAPTATSADIPKDAAKAAVAADVATLQKQLDELSSTQKKNLAVGGRSIALLILNYGGIYTYAKTPLGNWARDTFGYNGYHQWMANRGYAVLQPNYRGSGGYGDAFDEIGRLRSSGEYMRDEPAPQRPGEDRPGFTDVNFEDLDRKDI